ncbi:L,D-transpeptidase [Candidatus Jorgensenbacteria bacterium]|nr:L,D-transpeptidase [Candidatus Jorgensenbacteria bacterium]
MRRFGLLLGVYMIVFSSGAIAEGQTDTVNQLILIHLKSRILEFFENDSLVSVYPIRVGKPSRSTPLGEGYVAVKREKPVFRYVDPGPKQGMIVDTAECGDGFKRVNYKVMRSLSLYYTSMVPGQKIIKIRYLKPEGEDRYSIHSVTCGETIGQAISKGCVGMRIPDMLGFFPKVIVGKDGAKFIVTDD